MLKENASVESGLVVFYRQSSLFIVNTVIFVAKFFIRDLNFEKDIGANGVSVKVGPFSFLIDAGMDPKRYGNEALPRFDLLEDGDIDFIVLTHCHLDHLGSLPVVVRKQPQAQILSSYPAQLLAPLMLENSYSVMCRQKDELSIPEYPLFSKDEVAQLLKKFLPLKYGTAYTLEKEGHCATLTLFEAGHVLGASSVLIEYEGRQLLITGDILFSDQNSLKGARIPQLHSPDVVILETTRGATQRKVSRRSEEERLIKTIAKTIKRGGACLIPAFALGRMQEMLVLLYKAKKANKLPNCPIFCSGLGMSLINTFDEMGKKSACVNFSRQILRHLNVKSLRRKKLDPNTSKLVTPAIYLLSSGMLVEHTPAYNVAACLLGSAKNSICFVGYCDERTPGGELQKAKPGATFCFDAINFSTKIRAKIDRFDLSGHADREELCEFIGAQNPKKVVLVHGDEESRKWFSAIFSKNERSMSVLDPDVGKEYCL